MAEDGKTAEAVYLDGEDAALEKFPPLNRLCSPSAGERCCGAGKAGAPVRRWYIRRRRGDGEGVVNRFNKLERAHGKIEGAPRYLGAGVGNTDPLRTGGKWYSILRKISGYFDQDRLKKTCSDAK